MATQNGHLGVLEYLCSNRADLNVQDEVGDVTAADVVSKSITAHTKSKLMVHSICLEKMHLLVPQ